MIAMVRRWLLPAFLLACLLLGGSSQNIWGIFFLQLCALMLLANALVRPSQSATDLRAPMLFLGLTALLLVVQLIPALITLYGMLKGIGKEREKSPSRLKSH